MFRWAVVLLPLLGCGLMCIVGPALIALGLRRRPDTESGKTSDGVSTAPKPVTEADVVVRQ